MGREPRDFLHGGFKRYILDLQVMLRSVENLISPLILDCCGYSYDKGVCKSRCISTKKEFNGPHVDNAEQHENMVRAGNKLSRMHGCNASGVWLLFCSS
jgi:hypothetical protein